MMMPAATIRMRSFCLFFWKFDDGYDKYGVGRL